MPPLLQGELSAELTERVEIDKERFEMKILMIIDRMDCGGAETHVLELASGLVARGHRVCVVSSGGRLEHELLRRGVFYVRMPISKVGAMLSLGRICRLARCGNFDIIHSHSRVASFIADIVSSRTGVRLVTTVHAKFSVSYLKRKLSRWGSRSIAVSEDLGEYLAQGYGIAKENISVIPNGVDSSRFYPDIRARQGRTRIVFLSRLDSECSAGAFLLCEIAKRICDSFGRVEIVIGGGGDAFERVSACAARANSSIGFECVKVPGQIEDVPSFLRCADIFVGVSRAAIEAAFCGASVVLCGDEGFLGLLDENRFSLALGSNFCARGQKRASAELLYVEIARLLNTDISAREKNAERVRELMLGACDIGATVERTVEFYRRASKDEPSVVLCGYYGFGNVGDDALLLAAIRRARREFGDARIIAITRGGVRDGTRFGIKCVARKDVGEVLKAIKECKYFIFGGGTLLQDTTSRRSLVYYVSLLSLAKRSGARCYLWGNGIGEPRSEKSEKMIADALMGCEYIGLRDARSVDLAKRLLGNEPARIALESDLAEAERELFLSGKEKTELEIKGEFVVVALKGKRCPPELEERIRLERERGRTVMFVVMFPEQDLRLNQRYCKKYSGEIRSDIDFSDLVYLARRSVGVYSMRLHALVAAKIADVPFWGFGDSKVTDFGN